MFNVVIGAKGHSRRIPGKNLRLLHGKPLIYWSIRHALDLGLVPNVLTDHAEIKSAALGYGALVIDEPAEIAECDDSDYIYRYFVELTGSMLPILSLSPAAPFRDPAKTREGMELFRTGAYDRIAGGYKLQRLIVDKEYNFLDQEIQCCDLPVRYVIDDSLYITSATRALAKGFWHDCHERETIVETDSLRGVDLDEEDDWVHAEMLAPLFFGKNK